MGDESGDEGLAADGLAETGKGCKNGKNNQ